VLAEARGLVLGELERQGWAAGEGPIHRALDGALALARVRFALRELKAERRAAHRRDTESRRVTITANARDVLWSADATFVGRTPKGCAVQVEVVRDVASTCTLDITIGEAATGENVVRYLERLAEERGTAPLVFVTDNGPQYQSRAVADWCEARGVLQLFSRPHTPQHNPWAEHGMRELKEDACIDKGDVVLDNDTVLARLEQARERLDGARLRATRGWRTARDVDQELPHWREITTRCTFQSEVACGIRLAVLKSDLGRESRRAVREAILGALERTGAITRTRGRPDRTAQVSDDDS